MYQRVCCFADGIILWCQHRYSEICIISCFSILFQVNHEIVSVHKCVELLLYKMLVQSGLQTLSTKVLKIFLTAFSVFIVSTIFKWLISLSGSQVKVFYDFFHYHFIVDFYFVLWCLPWGTIVVKLLLPILYEEKLCVSFVCTVRILSVWKLVTHTHTRLCTYLGGFIY